MKQPSDTEYELLVIVAPRELSGRKIAERYKEQTGRQILYGTLYTTLRRMAESGWVTVREDEDEDGRLRHFRVTGLGEKALNTARDGYRSLANLGLPVTRRTR